MPLFVSHGEIAWVPGLAMGDRFKLTPGTKRAIRITAKPAPGPQGVTAVD
jgi:hypothetical protein